MQDKRLKEKQKAKEHAKRLAEIKAKRRGETTLARKAPELEENPLYLIYCEGKNTEPSYFKKFKLTSVDIDSFGEGKNTLSLVERAKQHADEAQNKNKKYDKIWCVFDADPKPDNPNQLKNFNAAVVKAKKYGFEVAYSNQAFEYWLLLHFADHQGGSMDRSLYGDALSIHLNKLGINYDYKGNKLINSDFFEALMTVIKKDKLGVEFTRCDIAISRAEKIYKRHDHRNPGKEESSTTVFLLVNELKKFIS